MESGEKCSWFNDHEQKVSTYIPQFTLNNKMEKDPFFNIINHQKSDFHSNKILKCSYENDNNTTEVIKTYTFKIHPNEMQKAQIFSWFRACNKVYNLCVTMFNEDSSNFSRNYKKQKLVIFEKLYGKMKKSAPYDVLTDEVSSFCKNLKSCMSNLRNGNITHFEMKNKSTLKGRSILMPKKAIGENGIFTNILKNMKGFEKINTDEILCDSRLVYDNFSKLFYLKCPMYCDTKKCTTKQNIVALDPGEKIFMAYHSLNDCGTIGNDFKQNILKYETKIKIIDRIIGRKKNKHGKRIKNNKKLKMQRLKYFKKITNMVKELHNKTALYLVRNYEKILIPSFETQNMVACYGKRYIKNKIKELKDEPLALKIEMTKVKKAKRLNKRVKFVLNAMSHYKFKQHLKHKCLEHGCKFEIVTEEYTSKCCSNCGHLSNKYDKDRLKICPYCPCRNDRDINGSKNILLKYSYANIHINDKTCMSVLKNIRL